MHTPRNLLSQWARLLIESLADAGLESVFISPGSRSTPLVAAVQHCRRLTYHVVIDERCAGFAALAHAKVSGRPSLLICTSGSAAAHYLPALIEADESCTPMLVLSADRPPELQANRAAQTIEQQQLFGSKARAFFELGMPDASDAALLGLRRKAAQAFALTRHPLPGPVYLNFPARKPLEPDLAAVRDADTPEAQLQTRVSALLGHTPRSSVGRLEPSAEIVEELERAARKAQRPALLLGPTEPFRSLDPELLSEFAARSGWPVLCEVTSGCRFMPAQQRGLTLCDAFDLVYRAAGQFDHAYRAAGDLSPLVPDLVLQLGQPSTSAAWNAIVQRYSITRYVVSPQHWPDPSNNAQHVVACDPSALLGRLSGCVKQASAQWRARLVRANQEAWLTVAEELSREGAQFSGSQFGEAPAPAFDEGDAVALLSEELSASDTLLLGNSLPVRLSETFLRAKAIPVRVLSQRGANGIDGLVSGALGAGLAAAHRDSQRTLALIGDITFLHDVGGLAALAELRPNVTLVVLNNGGGRIFEQLPLALDADEGTLAAWTTPHEVDLVQLAAAYGVPAYRAAGPESLKQALHLTRNSGPSLIEVQVSPHGAADKYRRLVAELVIRLRQALPKAT